LAAQEWTILTTIAAAQDDDIIDKALMIAKGCWESNCPSGIDGENPS
jgi:hypothetical protein